MTKLEHALALAARGFKVFPIAASAKAPPAIHGWPAKASADPEAVRLFWTAIPDANIGIHCEGMAVIDVDPRKGGDDSLELLRLTDGLPDTLTTRTPTGGRHLFYRLPDDCPAVPNSVGALGPGLDVRSTGGYVVAPGSEVQAGTYQFELETAAIACISPDLIPKLGSIAPKTGTTAAPVADAPESAVERAREWLAAQAPALEGQGGDARTFAVACGLRDMGVSAEQALDLMAGEWNARCVPPWEPKDLGVKVRNAYSYAQNEPGSRVALPTDFPIVQDEPLSTERGQARKLDKLLSLSEFAAQRATGAGYVIKGLLQRVSYAEIYGAPGEGKTFVALDLAYHVAAGAEWMGRKVHGGPVLYLAYEGTGGLIRRAQALRQQYGDADVPLYLAGAALDLRGKPGRQALGELMGGMPAKPVLIVIDTFARALMGGDENSAQDVGAFNSAVAALIENTGACVLIIHHSGKDKSKGARGSSALLGALDTEIEIDGGQIIARKQRDVEIAPAIGFKLTPVMVGMDADGDELTSCIVEPAAIPQVAGLERITGNSKRAFDVLCQIRPDNRPIDPADWRDACREFMGKNIAQRFYDVRKKLLATGHIVVDERGLVTRRMD